jgi:hypothetical protein
VAKDYRDDFKGAVDELKNEDFFEVVIKKVMAAPGPAWINDEPNPEFIEMLAGANLAVHLRTFPRRRCRQA